MHLHPLWQEGQGSTPSPRIPPVLPRGRTMLQAHAPGHNFHWAQAVTIIDSDIGSGAGIVACSGTLAAVGSGFMSTGVVAAGVVWTAVVVCWTPLSCR